MRIARKNVCDIFYLFDETRIKIILQFSNIALLFIYKTRGKENSVIYIEYCSFIYETRKKENFAMHRIFCVKFFNINHFFRPHKYFYIFKNNRDFVIVNYIKVQYIIILEENFYISLNH